MTDHDEAQRCRGGPPNGLRGPADFAARALTILLLLVAPVAGLSHGAEQDWDVSPNASLRVLLPLLAATALYAAGVLRRHRARGLAGRDVARALCFVGALALLLMALVWPLDGWAEASFSAHMAQHMVLVTLAPPLLVLARPGSVWLRGLPARWRVPAVRPRQWPLAAGWRRATTSVGAMVALQAAVLWGWHLPAVFDLALRNDAVHWLEHITLLASGVLFWRVSLVARSPILGGLAGMVVTLLHTGLLGALLALSTVPLYRAYVSHGDAAQVLADQQLAGLIMWIPMGTVYVIAALLLAGRALGWTDAEPRPA